MGQHGNHSIHQINTGSTAKRLLIQGTVLCHIMTHIRNVDTQPIAVGFPADGNGIIQILCILTVYGYCLPAADILSSLHFFCRHLIRNPAYLLHHLRRIFFRKPISLYNRKDICSRIVDVTNNFRHPSLRLFPGSAKAGQPYHYLMACNGSHIFSFRYKDIRSNFLVIRDHKPEMPVFLVISHQSFISPLQNPNHRSLRSASGSGRFCRNLHLVTVHGIPRLIRRNINILLAALQNNKAKASGTAGKGSSKNLLFWTAIFTPFRKNNLSICNQSIQNLFELLTPLSRHVQQHGKLLQLHRHIGRIFHQRQQALFPFF